MGWPKVWSVIYWKPRSPFGAYRRSYLYAALRYHHFIRSINPRYFRFIIEILVGCYGGLTRVLVSNLLKNETTLEYVEGRKIQTFKVIKKTEYFVIQSDYDMHELSGLRKVGGSLSISWILTLCSIWGFLTIMQVSWRFFDWFDRLKWNPFQRGKYAGFSSGEVR